MVNCPNTLASRPGRRGAITTWSLGLVLASGCYQGADADGDGGEPTATDSSNNPSGADVGETDDEPTGGPHDPTEGSADTDDPPGVDALPQTSRYPRLSHTQWENTVQDLFGLAEPTGYSNLFIGDPISGGFDNNSEALKVSATLWTDYQRGAEQVAELVAGDPELLAKVAPQQDGDSDEQARAFITSFGRRAYRRPLTAEEIDRHVEIFNAGVATPGELAAFPAGVRLVIQSMLQSPNFLYRVEASQTDDGTGKIRLSSHEIASKLSYMRWNTMPDALLFAAADADKLATTAGVAAEAARLLEHPRAHAMVANFHHQLLHIDHYSDVYKDPVKFPNYDPAMNAMMATETLMFVDDVIFGQNGDLAKLLTAPYTFVNAKLAPFYGVEGEFGDEFVKVDLDPSKRAGILTQLGFLNANAGAFENDPIHRGVFMNLQLLCTGLPPPPNMVPPLPAPVPGQTLRERVDAHTGIGTCGEGCHGYLINPLGFAFENYDPLGQWQSMDAGKPVNAAAEFNFDGTVQKFDGAVELANQVADSKQAHRCYVAHFLEYGYARTPQKADNAFLDKVASASLAGTASIKQIILELTKSDAFLYRAPVEE